MNFPAFTIDRRTGVVSRGGDTNPKLHPTTDRAGNRVISIDEMAYAMWLYRERGYPAWRAYQAAFEQFEYPPALSRPKKIIRETAINNIASGLASGSLLTDLEVDAAVRVVSNFAYSSDIADAAWKRYVHQTA